MTTFALFITIVSCCKIIQFVWNWVFQGKERFDSTFLGFCMQLVVMDIIMKVIARRITPKKRGELKTPTPGPRTTH